MTCIVGIAYSNKVYLGSDSLGSGNGVKQVYITPKLVKLDIFEKRDLTLTKIPLGIGYTTSYRMGDLLRYNFTPPPIEHDEDENEYLVKDFIPELIKCFDDHSFARTKEGTKSGGNFLVGLRKRLFHVQEDFSVLEPSCGYTAVGSGQEFAMGALYAYRRTATEPEKSVVGAIRAATEFCTTVGGTVDCINI
jgi:hypothetical protein